MTPEEADKAYDEAPSIPIGDEEIERMVKYATSHKITQECEFCGDPATRVEKFDRDVFVCDECSA